LTPNHILRAKKNWENEVQEMKVHKASISGEIHAIEFLNVPRILELSKEILKKIPQTQYTKELVFKNLINKNGDLNINRIKVLANNPYTPLIFFGPYGSTMLNFHYFDIFKNLLNNLNFKDLDKLLNRTSIKSGIIGEYCFYVGGLYSKKLNHPISSESEMVKFFFKRKPFIVEWLIDPHYFTSSSAKFRISDRNVYTIYGKIMNVNFAKIESKSHIIIDIRPYCFGLPIEKKNRKPDIAYQREIDEIFDDL